jgi:predicted nucleic-acid-binding protein
MFAVNTYEEIEKKEIEIGEKHLIIFLFVRPSLAGAKEIIDEFNYIHYNSGRYCSIYAIGYTNDSMSGYDSFTKIKGIQNSEWYYSDVAFVQFKRYLEKRLKWRYSGEIEMIILQSNPEGRNILNFTNYIAVDVLHGIRKEYIESFPRFMETLIRSSQSQVEVKPAIQKAVIKQIKIKDIVYDAISESKRIPTPVKKILKDSLFYRTSKSYST